MRDTRRRGLTPSFDALDGRRLLAAGISASLAQGVLAVQGTSSSEPIRVDLVGLRGPRRPAARVIVDGVGRFRAGAIQSIQIQGVEGEPVQVTPRLQSRFPIRISSVGDATIPQGSPPATASSTSVGPTPAPPSANTVIGAMSALEQAVFTLTNQVRAQNGLAPLAASGQLVTAAQVHSTDMARANVLAHDLPGVAMPTPESRAAAVGYDFSWFGENIAYNYADPESVLRGWMQSPGHRENILNPNFTELGVGIAWNGLGEPYYTQEFGRPA
jgi:uncharacterized protein YkwD